MRRGTPPDAADIMLASVTDNTMKQYNTYLRKWYIFCTEKGYDLFDVCVTNVLDFFMLLFNEGFQYGTINTTKAALALILDPNIMSNPSIKRFMTGVSKLRSPLPRYNCTWDPAPVLDYLNNWHPNESLSFEKLSKKLTTILALVTAHRVQTLSLIRLSNIHKFDQKFIINISDKIKTSSINRQQPSLILPYFNERPSICPARILECYLKISASKRSSDCEFLLISFKKPYKSVTSQTLSRWIKATLSESGVDTSIFKSHSTRHAATSAANRLGVNIDLIKKTAGWSGNSQTFARFYNREVTIDSSETFARSLLQASLD